MRDYLFERKMYVCIIDPTGKTLFHRNMDASPENLLSALKPNLPDIVVGVECVFTWYWIADFCEDNNIPFGIGHALYSRPSTAEKPKTIKSTPLYHESQAFERTFFFCIRRY